MATNKYGLDNEYFRKKLKCVIRDINNYTPDEMFNELSRMMMVAANQAEINVVINIKNASKVKK